MEYRIRKVVKGADGELQIWEHKFTKSLLDSDTYWDRYKFDWQVGLYQVAAAKIYGADRVVIVLNALRVPQLRQGKSEGVSDYLQRIEDHIAANPSDYFRQAKIKWSAESLARVENEVRELAERIPQQTYFPRSRRCLEWNRLCGYYPKCFEGASLQNENLYQLRSKRA